MRIKLGIPLYLAEIAKHGGGILSYGKDLAVEYIVTNSKEAACGDLFVALSGKSTDGEIYAEDAKGSGAFVLGTKKATADILCENCLDFLLRLSSYYITKLESLKSKIAITGSVGKTTSKEFLAKFLEKRFVLHKTPENFNNFLGTALTVLSAPKNTEILLTEMGMNKIGEISRLSSCVKPNYAIITNVGTAHIGMLGSRNLIAKAKLEIKDGMNGGVLFVPMDELLLSESGGVSFSLTDIGADYYLDISEENWIKLYKNGTLIFKGRTKLTARHHLYALLIALSVSHEIGIDSDTVLNVCQELDDRFLRKKTEKVGIFYFEDDTYSSSPEAVKAELLYLNTTKKCFSVLLGDMLELGNMTEEKHREIGRLAYECGARILFTFGVYSHFIKTGALDAGMKKECIFTNTDTGAPAVSAEQILKYALPGETVLFKASHALGAERIIKIIKDKLYAG